MHILEFLYIENGKILKENKFGKNLKKKKGENIYFFTLASKKFWAFRLINLIILIIDSIKNYFIELTMVVQVCLSKNDMQSLIAASFGKTSIRFQYPRSLRNLIAIEMSVILYDIFFYLIYIKIFSTKNN